jgi:hypothetical protein
MMLGSSTTIAIIPKIYCNQVIQAVADIRENPLKLKRYGGNKAPAVGMRL